LYAGHTCAFANRGGRWPDRIARHCSAAPVIDFNALSGVMAAMCGEAKTLSNSNNGCPSGGGSSIQTSNPAPAISFALKASASAASS
jgi:hypothetical protein